MSGWSFPALEQFKEEGVANVEILYQNIRTALDHANARANTNFQASTIVQRELDETKQRLSEAIQQRAPPPPESEQVQQLQQQIHQVNSENNRLEADIVALNAQLAIARQAPDPQNPPPPPPPPPVAQRSEKMPDPEKFDGTRNKVTDFLTQMRLKLTANQDRFLNNEAITMYIV